MSDIWNDPSPVHYDDEERFGTASEMIREIRSLRARIAELGEGLRKVSDEYEEWVNLDDVCARWTPDSVLNARSLLQGHENKP